MIKIKITSFVSLLFVISLTACGGSGDNTNFPSSNAVIMTDVTSLRVIDNFEGNGEVATSGRELSVYYEGWLYDEEAVDFRGELFDSVIDGTPFDFTLDAGEVILGWEQGLAGMQEGGNRTLIIPSGLAFGSQGQGPIPPNTAVVFDVELLAVE